MTATVSAGMTAGVLSYAQTRGVAPAEVWAKAGAVPLSLRPDDRVDITTYLALVREARALVGDDAFSLHYGAQVSMTELSIVGLIMEASATMGDALAQLHRYGRLAADIAGTGGQPLYLTESAAGLFLDMSGMDMYPELVEEACARLVVGPRRFLSQAHVISASFAFPAPAHQTEFEAVLGCPVQFDAPRTALQLHPHVSDWPVAPHSGYVFGVLRSTAEKQLAELPAHGEWAQRVSRIVKASIHTGETTAEATAHALHCSRSTLARRLADEGTDFSTIVNAVRRDLAMAYLTGGHASVNQIAYLAGFAEPSAFIRAFRRWTGMNPGDYRNARGRTT